MLLKPKRHVHKILVYILVVVYCKKNRNRKNNIRKENKECVSDLIASFSQKLNCNKVKKTENSVIQYLSFFQEGWGLMIERLR